MTDAMLIVATSAHLLSALGMLAALALHAWLGRRAARTTEGPLRRDLEGARARLTRPLWALGLLVLAAGAWSFIVTTPVPVAYESAHHLLLLAELIFLAQVALGLAALTVRPAGEAARRWHVGEGGAAAVAGLSLVSGALLVLVVVAAAYASLVMGAL
jgi:hypothetical protein